VLTSKPAHYTRLGLAYVLLSVPSWALLLAGRLFEGRNPHLLLALAGLPLGALFLLFGRGRLRGNTQSAVAVRLGAMAVFLVIVLLGSLLVARAAGVEQLMTSVLFCGMAASYLSLVALGLLIAAVVMGRRRTPEEP